MIPAPFEYERPASLADALAALEASGGAARPIAGGQSFLPLMKLRLARPERLVDIGRLEELRGIRELPDGRLAIGALTTWAELLGDRRVVALGALGDAVPQIGDVAIRNRGTIGGSLAHADPAADIAAPLLALEAEIIVRSMAGERAIPIAAFFVGPFTTSLGPGELITEVRIPVADASPGSAYVAVTHPASGYPIAGAAVALRRSADAGTAVATCRVGITGVGELPYRAAALEAAIESGTSPDEATAGVAEGRRVLSDPYADRTYRTAMAVVVARRAIAAATLRSGHEAPRRVESAP